MLLTADAHASVILSKAEDVYFRPLTDSISNQ